jgi:hypothetical protein
MNLLRAAGLVEAAPVASVPDVVRPALVDEAIRFLRVGTLSLAEWGDLEPVEKAAFTEAAETVLAERAAAHGFASVSEMHARAVASKSDGGASLKDALLARAVDGMARAAPGEPSVPS